MTGFVWVDERDALLLHERLLAVHGGAVGVRDQGLLQSAMARARNLPAYVEQTGILELAAAYTAGIVKNHPFIDGNKRTGFIVGVLFLELNGYRFTASEVDAANAVLALAAGELDESDYADFLTANSAKV